MMIGARDRGLGKLYTIVIIGLLGSKTVGQVLNPVKKPCKLALPVCSLHDL